MLTCFAGGHPAGILVSGGSMRHVGLRLLVAIVIAARAAPAFAESNTSVPALMEAYLRPYVATQNFSGSVLVSRDGRTVFSQSYGSADAEKGRRNTLRTQFHLASMSMQFTAAAIMRLVDSGRLTLDMPVAEIVPALPQGDKITIRHLLTQTSGMANINDLSDYPQVLETHQNADSLVKRVLGLPALREPGGAYAREEQSAYNLLALIIEKKTGLGFATAMRRLVFAPLNMGDSGIDDDSPHHDSMMAKGYEPLGVFGLRPAHPIHWSAKTGNASAYTTVLDEQKWLGGLFETAFLSAAARATIFDMSARVGYGWFKSNNPRFGAPVYSMNGRAPGFASAMMYFPETRLSVVVLSNIYASVTTRIANDLTALALALPVESPNIRTEPLARAVLAGLHGDFSYGADFYQPNATLRLRTSGEDVTLVWPNGDISALIPTGPDRFVDRSYWVAVELKRDGRGDVQLIYDRFTGQITPARP
jgi:CubicO group peptidase (beta-lactamase class C family)